jgi:hypothetical protein
MAFAFQQPGCQPLVDAVVFGQREEPLEPSLLLMSRVDLRPGGRPGKPRVTTRRKVLPWPDSLSTDICPSINFTCSEAMD